MVLLTLIEGLRTDHRHHLQEQPAILAGQPNRSAHSARRNHDLETRAVGRDAHRIHRRLVWISAVVGIREHHLISRYEPAALNGDRLAHVRRRQTAHRGCSQGRGRRDRCDRRANPVRQGQRNPVGAGVRTAAAVRFGRVVTRVGRRTDADVVGAVRRNPQVGDTRVRVPVARGKLVARGVEQPHVGIRGRILAADCQQLPGLGGKRVDIHIIVAVRVVADRAADRRQRVERHGDRLHRRQRVAAIASLGDVGHRRPAERDPVRPVVEALAPLLATFGLYVVLLYALIPR